MKPFGLIAYAMGPYPTPRLFLSTLAANSLGRWPRQTCRVAVARTQALPAPIAGQWRRASMTERKLLLLILACYVVLIAIAYFFSAH
jgi:hypothetical protein